VGNKLFADSFRQEILSTEAVADTTDSKLTAFKQWNPSFVSATASANESLRLMKKLKINPPPIQNLAILILMLNRGVFLVNTDL
jgi:hypothetical protein